MIYNVVLISAVQQNESVIHTYILFLYSFPLWFISGYSVEFPGLYSRTLLPRGKVVGEGWAVSLELVNENYYIQNG